VKNNFLNNITRGMILALILTALIGKEAIATTDVNPQYAAASKPFSSDTPTVSTATEIDEINAILQSTSRKIALLEAGANPETAQDTKAGSSEKVKLAKEITPDAYEDDLRKQTLKSIESKQNIAEEFRKAKAIKINPGTPSMFAYEKPIKYQTQEEIIKSVITDEVLQKKIDLDFDETALGDIIQTISKIASVNIVLDPTMKNNKFDLHLASVSVQEALLLIGDSFKLGYKRVGDSLYGTLREDLLKQSETSRVFKLKNINASQAKELLGDMAKKVEISQDLNSLIAQGQPEDIEQLEKAIIRLDQPQPQVVLEAKIIEITRDGLRELGIDWSDQITTNFQEAGRPVTLGNVETGGADAIKLYSLARNPVQFSAALNMLENQNKAKILSSPSITTLNGKESEIFIGDRIPYTVTNVTGGVATTDVRWVEPGIRLTITPSIIGEDFVVIKVEPEVSFIFAFRGPNSEFPHIKTREATAYVRIKNNEPFILGGLLGQEDKKNLYKVPLLGNIPWIGNLFTNEKTTTSDVELIITITPTIVYGNLN
jgi:type IV pilus assembly protein PilQ